MANNIDKVRILLVGDSGVGKTCLTHLIAHNESLSRPGWTIGVNIEVKLHEYKEGTPQQQLNFIEIFDIGGSLSHKNARGVFYTPVDGIVLVHDLTNRKSHENLREWLYEILNKNGKDTYKPGSNTTTNTSTHANASNNSFDPEQFVGVTQLPILVMGTKLDLLDEKRQPKTVQKAGGIADQCGAEEIWLNCRNPRSLAAGTTDAVKLARFFDRVIEKKMHTRDTGYFSANLAGAGVLDRRRYTSPPPSYNTSESSLLMNSPTLMPMENKTSTPRPQTYGNVLMETSGLQ